jgi:hypothetical protein
LPHGFNEPADHLPQRDQLKCHCEFDNTDGIRSVVGRKSLDVRIQVESQTRIQVSVDKMKSDGKDSAKTRSICALFIGLRLLCMVYGVIR